MHLRLLVVAVALGSCHAWFWSRRTVVRTVPGPVIWQTPAPTSITAIVTQVHNTSTTTTSVMLTTSTLTNVAHETTLTQTSTSTSTTSTSHTTTTTTSMHTSTSHTTMHYTETHTSVSATTTFAVAPDISAHYAGNLHATLVIVPTTLAALPASKHDDGAHADGSHVDPAVRASVRRQAKRYGFHSTAASHGIHTLPPRINPGIEHGGPRGDHGLLHLGDAAHVY